MGEPGLIADSPDPAASPTPSGLPLGRLGTRLFPVEGLSPDTRAAPAGQGSLPWDLVAH